MHFFVFLPTNENMKKTLKKSLFRQNFLLYSNCIYYTCKRGFCLKPVNTPKNVEKHVIYFFSEKKEYIPFHENSFFSLKK